MAYKKRKKICSWCKKEFDANKPIQICCSLGCAQRLRWSHPTYKERVIKKIKETKRKLYAEGKLVGSHKGKKLSPTHIANMKIGMKGRTPWNKGVPRTKEIKELLSKIHKGKIIPEDVRQRTSQTMKKVAKELLFARHFIVGRTVSPNKAEGQFISLCQEYKLPFKFTGDGTFWIENINPDFVEVNGRKIAVDIFGDYWHTPLFVGQALVISRTEEGRKAIAKKYGWKLVIIWQSEFDLPSFEERILSKLRKVGIKI